MICPLSGRKTNGTVWELAPLTNTTRLHSAGEREKKDAASRHAPVASINESVVGRGLGRGARDG